MTPIFDRSREMHKITFVLSCVACASYGCRLQGTSEGVRGDIAPSSHSFAAPSRSKLVGQATKPNPTKSPSAKNLNRKEERVIDVAEIPAKHASIKPALALKPNSVIGSKIFSPLKPFNLAAVFNQRHSPPGWLIVKREGVNTARPYQRCRGKRVTNSLQATNCGMFVMLNLRRSSLFKLLAKSDIAIRQGGLHRLVTSMFLHVDFPHLLVNSFSLHNMGTAMEPYLGRGRFIATYVASGIMGNMLSFAVGNSPVGVGASGAICGLVGAYGVFLKLNSDYCARRGISASRALNDLSLVVALNFVYGMTPGSGIDNMAHLGGLAGGALAGWVIGPRLTRRRSPLGLTAVFDEPLVRLPGT